MLQAFVQNVSSVPEVCSKRFDPDVLHKFHTYVATTCFICFICFRRILQMFYLDVAYVTMTMLQVYVLNVSSVQSYVAIVSSECCKSRSQCRVV
jgi:hypothetical protein